jgi:hypothetical protein
MPNPTALPEAQEPKLRTYWIARCNDCAGINAAIVERHTMEDALRVNDFRQDNEDQVVERLTVRPDPSEWCRCGEPVESEGTIRPVEVLPGDESEVDLAGLFARHADRPVVGSYDLVAHLHRQRVFSRRTFGPGPTVARILDHARKEIAEIERDPTDLEEWIDLATLAFDGAWRQGYTSGEIAAAFAAKLAKNEKREWPDWRTADPDKAIEHVHGGEPPNGGGDDE